MKINRNALADSFMREWEVTVLPADFPDELNTICELLDREIKYADDISCLTKDQQEIINKTGDEGLFLTKKDLEQQKEIHDAEEELYCALETLKNANVSEEEIQEIFHKFIQENL